MIKCEITCDNCGKVLMAKELKTTLFKANSVHRICFEKGTREKKYYDMCEKCFNAIKSVLEEKQKQFAGQ